MKKHYSAAPSYLRLSLFLAACFSFIHQVNAQQNIPLNDLSAFKDPGKSWQISGNVTADLNQQNVLKPAKGQGILVNLPGKKDHGTDLFTKEEYADLDLELDYMMAKGSNSGIYLQGRYELQLFDSWAKPNTTSGGNGGIYERWDESRGKGNEGYNGHAPRQNVSRAPGLWQHLKVVFQAPRFDATGKKTDNARMLRVELNGVLIHENLELEGPTRGAVSNTEAAKGPLRFQGDHGAIAIRNIKIKNFDKPRPEITDLKYKIYDGKFQEMPSFDTMKVILTGNTNILSSAVNKKENEFLLHYTGNVVVKAPGDYRFSLHTSGGNGALKVNNQLLKGFNSTETKSITLQPGTYPIEVVYSKYISWERNSLGLSISSDDVREYLVSDPSSIIEEAVDPIMISASSNTIMRSFMDLPGGKRVVHAVSVGSPHGLHYTYDLDHGMLLQAWRGGFLDATPMWHDRGDGSSRPMGSKIVFGGPSFNISQLADAQQAWSNDTTGTGFVVKGYETDDQDNPTFKYQLRGATVFDGFKISDNGESLQRKIRVENNPGNLYIKIAEGQTIEPVSSGLYLIDDKKYYVRFENGAARPAVRTSNGKSELVVPVQSEITYSILF